jgi:hypothetical protein
MEFIASLLGIVILISLIILAVYGFWRLLKFILRELFYTAAKAIEDAKNR